MAQRTLIIFKPDCLHRGLVSTLLQSWENKGFRIEQLKVATPTVADMERHYAEHVGKPFYPALITRYSPTRYLITIF
jgi:nucleoside-diphosphate kinase